MINTARVDGLPTGTVTLLFSDIEGSTALLHRLGPRWGEALSAQRALLRAAWAEHHGIEMGTEGDSFFVVFGSAHDAVAAAIAGQRSLHAHDWPDDAEVRVRMGIHTGEPTRHEDGYIGEDVHRAARIASTAHGGQIVVSAETRRLLRGLTDVEVRELGEHRLKDLPDPEPLFDLVVPGLPSQFPPLRSLGRRSALPIPPTPLIGRDDDLAAVRAVLTDPDSRLVTITGTGGSGKTRLAIAVADDTAAEFTAGVYFVPLAAVRDAAAMSAAIADALDADTSADGDLTSALRARLTDRAVLLVLDNVEQVEGADEVVADLLSAGTGVRVLATSRRPLLLAAEREYPLDPLSLPRHTDADVTASAAVQLFVAQARRARPAFTVTDDNRDAVAELCRRLDGLPLALELAAAQTRVFSPQVLLGRVDSRLGAGFTAADRPERHRTLGATIAWSHDLLDESDRAVLRRLAVFRGPADLAGAAAITKAGDDIFEALTRLAAANLVRIVDGPSAEPRVTMLETIRTFAVERLQAAGDEEASRVAHLDWALAAVRDATGLLRGAQHTRGLDVLAALNDDVRAALEFALPDDAALAVPERVATGHALLVEVTTRYWNRFGSASEAWVWQERGLRLAAESDTPTNVGLLHALGMSLIQQGDFRRALDTLRRSLEMATALDERDLRARALNAMGIAYRTLGEPQRSEDVLRQSLAISTETGNRQLQSFANGNLAVVRIDLHDYAGAAQAAQRGIELNTELGDEWGISIDRLNYATAVLNLEGVEPALALFREWAPALVALRDNELLIDAMEFAALVLAGTGRHRDAVRVLAGADRRRATLPMLRSAPEQAIVDTWMERTRHTMSPAEWQAAYDEGRDVTPEEAIDLVASVQADIG